PSVFFFFQAEDGIRDFHVTGVQTCALPILLKRAADEGAAALDGAKLANLGVAGETIAASAARLKAAERGVLVLTGAALTRADARSEERRVGRAGRSRGAAERQKENGER